MERYEVLFKLISEAVLPSGYGGMICDPTYIEIGVRDGQTLRYLAEKMRDKFPLVRFRAYGIDPYLPYKDGANFVTQAEQEDCFKAVLAIYAKHPNVAIYRGTSTEFIHHQWEVLGSKIKADIVFIDGDHSYEAVKKDIATWYPRTNRILAGHDYDMGHVTQAVTEFAKEHNLQVFHAHYPADVWWVEL